MLVYWSVTTSIFVSGFYSDGSNTFWNPSWILDMEHITFLSLKTADLTEYGVNMFCRLIQIHHQSCKSGIPEPFSASTWHFRDRSYFPIMTWCHGEISMPTASWPTTYLVAWGFRSWAWPFPTAETSADQQWRIGEELWIFSGMSQIWGLESVWSFQWMWLGCCGCTVTVTLREKYRCLPWTGNDFEIENLGSKLHSHRILAWTGPFE